MPSLSDSTARRAEVTYETGSKYRGDVVSVDVDRQLTAKETEENEASQGVCAPASCAPARCLPEPLNKTADDEVVLPKVKDVKDLGPVPSVIFDDEE